MFHSFSFLIQWFPQANVQTHISLTSILLLSSLTANGGHLSHPQGEPFHPFNESFVTLEQGDITSGIPNFPIDEDLSFEIPPLFHFSDFSDHAGNVAGRHFPSLDERPYQWEDNMLDEFKENEPCCEGNDDLLDHALVKILRNPWGMENIVPACSQFDMDRPPIL
jgi:hypothetical protein